MLDSAVIRLDIECLGRRLDAEIDEPRRQKLESLLWTRYKNLTKALTEKCTAPPAPTSGRDQSRRPGDIWR